MIPLYPTLMKTLRLLALIGALTTASFAADKVALTENDTPTTIIAAQVGKSVELHLKSGEKIVGKVKTVGTKAVLVTALAGQEFYDAVVLLEDVSAVVFRNDGR
jgi:hypothetical protein